MSKKKKVEWDPYDFILVKNMIQELITDNYPNYVKVIISIEKSIEDMDLLDKIYSDYFDNSENLINDDFDDIIRKYTE